MLGAKYCFLFRKPRILRLPIVFSWSSRRRELALTTCGGRGDTCPRPRRATRSRRKTHGERAKAWALCLVTKARAVRLGRDERIILDFVWTAVCQGSSPKSPKSHPFGKAQKASSKKHSTNVYHPPPWRFYPSKEIVGVCVCVGKKEDMFSKKGVCADCRPHHRPCFELAQASRRPVASATLHASTSEAVQTPTICIVRPLLRPAAFWCLGLFHMAF